MCNCMNEMEEKMKELLDAESVEAPVELFTGKAYLEFTVKKKRQEKRGKNAVIVVTVSVLRRTV